MEHLLDDHKNHPNQQENNQRLSDEKYYLPLLPQESQLKLQKNDQKSSMEGRGLHNKG